MENQPQIITARWILPIQPSQTVLEEHCIVIDNGEIIELCKRDKSRKRYPNADIQHYQNHALMPGFINAHTHAAMSLFRGLADDLPLSDWLNQYIWPAEQQWVNTDFIRDGTELAIAEMLLSGTTCFNEMYYCPDIVAQTAQEIGIRAVVGLIVIDFPSMWAKDADEYLHKAIEVHDEVRSLSLVNCALAPHSPYMVGDAPLEQVQLYADELNIPIHMHIHETAQEITDAIAQNGIRPLERLQQLGLLTPRLLAVHLTQLTDEEIDLVTKQGVHIVHCPESNMKLASGICPIDELLQAGANICIGTDSAASNNDLDMLGELRSAALLAKNTSGNATLLPAWQALEMATINAAKALGLDKEIGSLEVGKAADMIAIDLNHIATQPVYDPAAQIVYSSNREQITDVWVHGNHVINNRKLKTIDTDRMLHNVVQWGRKISSN